MFVSLTFTGVSRNEDGSINLNGFLERKSGHSHDAPVFTWAEDATACTATFACYCGYSESFECVITSETTAPTCTAEGKTVYTATCGDFSDSMTVVLPAAGHTDMLIEFVAPTCEENGYEFYRCERCGAERQTILEKTGHNYEDGVCTECGGKDPDYKKPGIGGDWIGSTIGKWFEKWFGDHKPSVPPTEPEKPTEPPTESPTEPEKPVKPGKPGWGFIWDWIFWWN